MEKTAVVLAGGGSRGAYQIGVWQALRELKIPYHIVTGSSVGALNGALMVQGDYDLAVRIWSSLSSKDVLNASFATEEDGIDDKKVWAAFLKEVLEKGGADIAPLEQMVNAAVDEEKFRRSPVDFALVTVEYPSLKPLELSKKEIPEQMLAEYLLASAACFPAFQTREINGCRYMDGGYHDNLPINLALDLGADHIIAVDLQSIGVIRPTKRSGKRITRIRCAWSLGSFLVFDKTVAQRNMRLGYLDAKKALGILDGYSYAFEKESCVQSTRLLYASLVELNESAKQKDPALANALNRILSRHMLRDFLSKTSERRPFTVARQLILMAEYCGEAFGLAPTTCYSLQEFGNQILKISSALSPLSALSALPSTRGDLSNLSNLPKIIDEFKKQEKAQLSLLLAQRLEQFLQNETAGAEIRLLAATFWKEFLAAVYLLILKNLLPCTH